MDIEFPKINNKLVFFDFDRTLVAHKFSTEYASNNDYLMECIYALTSIDQEYAEDKPLPCMQWYAKKLFDEGYGIYCLTHELFNLRDELKQKQIKTFYPNIPMKYLTVDTPDHKIDMIKAISIIENCPLSDIIFVDDRMETIHLAIAAGIDAKHLSDIVALYECYAVPQQQDSFIRPKGLDGFLKDDPSLLEQVTHEQIENAGAGFSDEELEKAYQACRKIVDNEGGVAV